MHFCKKTRFSTTKKMPSKCFLLAFECVKREVWHRGGPTPGGYPEPAEHALKGQADTIGVQLIQLGFHCLLAAPLHAGELGWPVITEISRTLHGGRQKPLVMEGKRHVTDTKKKEGKGRCGQCLWNAGVPPWS